MENNQLPRRRPRSRAVYLLPNMFTAASLFTGFGAMVLSIQGRFELAAILIFCSMVLDGMDGRVARATSTQSAFGEQFDSLADMCAFGVAPALVVWQWVLHDLGNWGLAAALVYVAGAAIRLARFNVNITVVDKRFFQGVPSPTAAALVAGLVWIVSAGYLPLSGTALRVIAFIITVYAGVSMVSNAPFYSGKKLGVVRKVPFIGFLVGALVLILVTGNPAVTLFTFFCIYAVSGYVYQFYLWRKGLPNPVKPERDVH